MDLKDWGVIAAIIVSLISVSICYWFYRAGDKRETLRDKQKANDLLLEIAGSAVDRGYCSLTEAAEAVALFLTSVDGAAWIYMDKLNLQALVHQGVWIIRHSNDDDSSPDVISPQIKFDEDYEDFANEIKEHLRTRRGMSPDIEWKKVEV